MKLKPEDLAAFALAIVERLVPILQNMNAMPRSIVENRCVLCLALPGLLLFSAEPQA